MKIAVLFDGGGLARLGLEKAGHDCTGYEIDPAKHYLSQMVGSGNSVLADVRDVDLSGYAAVWASPPCQKRSVANTSPSERKIETYRDYDDLLAWSLNLPHKILWVENVITGDKSLDCFGRKYNAAQFREKPIQIRNRIIGGRYQNPNVWRTYKPSYLSDGWDICPAIKATEYKRSSISEAGGRNATAAWWYGRRLALRECAYHQGFDIPHSILQSWYYNPLLINPNKDRPYTDAEWRYVIYEAIGNGVPVYMAYGFGAVYSDAPVDAPKQLALFA